MSNVLGHRAVFSVVIPATNAVVEPDMATLRPPGVTNQTYRFAFPGLPATLEDLMDLMRPTLALSLACEPDRVVVGYTPEYMNDGMARVTRLRAFVEQAVGLPTTMASDAVPEALKAIGARRIGIITPFSPQANRNVEAFYAALGFSVAALVGLSTAHRGRVYTAQVGEAQIREAFAQADGPDVEALVQVGTALVCANLVASLEAHHAKPVVAVNPAAYWLALRSHGIDDRLDGHGMIFGEH